MISRRTWVPLAAIGFAKTLRAQKELTVAGKKPLLVLNDFPEDLETPAEYFDRWITPNDVFFVRQHLPRPKMDPSSYRLEISGMVGSPVQLSLEELRKLPQTTVVATLECAGNGRSYYRPRMPGLPWSKGAIGNAEWRGPRISDLLKKAGGVASGAQYGTFDGADVGLAQTPDFIRSVPVRKLLHPATILALEMNGEPLPELHGFPARLVVPGWDGASWVKWVTKIVLSEKPDSGFYMATAYKYPRRLTPPGVPPRPEEMESIEGMAVKSFFTKPAREAKFKLGPVLLQGVAWAGEHRVLRVEVSVDGGASWRQARLSPQNLPFAWRLWSFEWTPRAPGYYLACVRATDSAGRTQPIEAPWNPSGYLWNSIERIGLLVEA
ncbi:MAG: sulfite oxidase [Bryobacteraceae bacterium]|nr:sulfite oxidase [Bryobacteraceae bacterium]MDW8377392.1 sulfite oxidase [Bryobacterales bacterium]